VSEKIRSHLDENADPAIAAGLRRYGIDVTTTQEVRLLNRSDEEQLKYICENNRVIFTQDTDFLRIASYNQNHPGVTYCQKGTRSIGEIIAGLHLIYEVFSPEEMIGQVEFL
jgi:predicted nuclease of predicted toxin-antitoxin system